MTNYNDCPKRRHIRYRLSVFIQKYCSLLLYVVFTYQEPSLAFCVLFRFLNQVRMSSVTHLSQPQADSDRILWEVLQELQPHRGHQQQAQLLRAGQIQRIRPLLDYAIRLQWRAGHTPESEAALKRFVYRFLSGSIPLYD